MDTNTNITHETANSFQNSLLSYLDQAEKSEFEDSFYFDEDSITTKEQANYFIRKVKEYKALITDINEAADMEIEKQIERINAWRKSASEGYQFSIDTYTTKLRDFWNNNAIDGKTIKLSQGSLCMRKSRDKEVYDENTVLQFIEDTGLEQYTNKVPNKAKIKEDMIINADGSVTLDNYTVQGFSYTKQMPKFEVK